MQRVARGLPARVAAEQPAVVEAFRSSARASCCHRELCGARRAHLCCEERRAQGLGPRRGREEFWARRGRERRVATDGEQLGGRGRSQAPQRGGRGARPEPEGGWPGGAARRRPPHLGPCEGGGAEAAGRRQQLRAEAAASRPSVVHRDAGRAPRCEYRGRWASPVQRRAGH
jgi:hypothetical protein